MISKPRARWGHAQGRLSNAEMHLQKAISSQKHHNFSLKGEGEREDNMRTHTQLTSTFGLNQVSVYIQHYSQK